MRFVCNHKCLHDRMTDIVVIRGFYDILKATIKFIVFCDLNKPSALHKRDLIELNAFEYCLPQS